MTSHQLIRKIRILNRLYDSMMDIYSILKKEFKNHQIITHGILQTEKAFLLLYQLILKFLETEAINKEFNYIVKELKAERKRKKL